MPSAISANDIRAQAARGQAGPGFRVVAWETGQPTFL